MVSVIVIIATLFIKMNITGSDIIKPNHKRGKNDQNGQFFHLFILVPQSMIGTKVSVEFVVGLYLIEYKNLVLGTAYISIYQAQIITRIQSNIT